MRHFYLIVLVGIQYSFFPCQAAIKSNDSRLIRAALMEHYDPLVFPVVNPSQPVYLNVTIGVRSFIQLDMKRQTLVFFGWLTVTWYDQFLGWDPNWYNMQRQVRLEAAMVWHPDLVIYNTVTDINQLENQKSKVIVEHTGRVTWYPGGLFQTFCSINVFHYPLDTQTCSVEIIPWSSANDVLTAALIEPPFRMSDSVEDHPEWTLVDKKSTYTLRPDNF
ncbi:hypothetical protein ACOMHN_027153 [Nucella lapillus]